MFGLLSSILKMEMLRVDVGAAFFCSLKISRDLSLVSVQNEET